MRRIERIAAALLLASLMPPAGEEMPRRWRADPWQRRASKQRGYGFLPPCRERRRRRKAERQARRRARTL